MSKGLLLIGGGGHCKSIIDSLCKQNIFEKIEIIDFKKNVGKTILGYKIIGTDDDLVTLFNEGYEYAFITFGNNGDLNSKIKQYHLIKKIGYRIPTIIDKSANVSNNALIEEGVFIGKNVIINAGSIIKKGSIINTGTIVEHDCEIGEFTNLAPGVVLGGSVKVDQCSVIGMNSTIKNQVSIGKNSIIGMGSNVLKNIQSNVIAYGNPCKEIKNI